MTDARERVNREALAWVEENDNGDYYWSYTEEYMVQAFIAGRTVSREQVQRAGCAANISDDKAAEVLAAAGFHVEGDDEEYKPF